MQKRKPSFREMIGNLTRENAYGSFSELGRRLAPYFSSDKGAPLKPETVSRYLREMTLGDRAIPENIKQTINRRRKHFEYEAPRAEIRKIEGVEGRIEYAKGTSKQIIDIAQLLPPGTDFFAFDFKDNLANDPRFKYVKEALEQGLTIRVTAVGEGAEGTSKRTGLISGTDLIETKTKGGKKKSYPRYESQIYHIFRAVYEDAGEVAVITLNEGPWGDGTRGEI